MSVIESLLGVVTSTCGRKSAVSSIPSNVQQHARLAFEALEDRCVPATVSWLSVSQLSSSKLMVKALDSQNNIVTNFTGTVHFSTADTTAIVPPDYTFLASDFGVAVVAGFTIGKKKLPVTATQVQRPSVTGSMQTGGFTFGGQDTLTVVAPAGVLPGVPFSITIRKTTFGLPYSGTVRFETSDSNGIVPSDYTFSSDDVTPDGIFSRHTFSNLVLNSLGPQTLYISESIENGYYSVPIAVGPYFSTSTTPPVDSAILANTTFQFTVTASLNGYANSNYFGKVRFVSSDPLAILPKNYQFTSLDQGVKTFPIIFRTSGIQQVQIIDTVTNTIQGSSSLFVFPGPVSKFIVAAPAKVNSGSSYTMKIIPVDAFNNYVSNYKGTIAIASTDPEASVASSYTFQINQGFSVLTVTGSRPRGQQILRVNDTVNPLLKGQAVVGLIENPALKVGYQKLNPPVSATLNDAQLAPLLVESLNRWKAAGYDISSLQGIQVRITNFGDRRTISQRSGNTIWLDDNAADWGWFVDNTPSDNSEFDRPLTPGVYNRIDVLTVISHEIGHMLGFNDSIRGVMNQLIAPGKRSSPN